MACKCRQLAGLDMPTTDTEQVPKSIYLTVERLVATKPTSVDLSAIEIAFQQAPRVSSNWVKHDDRRIYLLNGAHTNNLGVGKKAVSDDSASAVTVSLTGLERTLVDIAGDLPKLFPTTRHLAI
jgi:hypothetical protein